MEGSTVTSTAIPSDDDDLLTEDIFHQNNDLATADYENQNGELTNNAEGEDGVPSDEPQVKIRKKLNTPRLNEQRLCSKHGIPSLQKVFQTVKFKGPGHEAANLKILLRQYEYWGNQLFPKYCFEDFVEKVEDLGFKSSVKMCVNRLRRGEEIFPEENDNVEDNQSTANDGDITEQFEFGALVHDQDDIDPPPMNQAREKESSITEELRNKIERNKKIALERRAAREALAKQQTKNNESNNLQHSTQNGESSHNEDRSDCEMIIDNEARRDASKKIDSLEKMSEVDRVNEQSDEDDNLVMSAFGKKPSLNELDEVQAEEIENNKVSHTVDIIHPTQKMNSNDENQLGTQLDQVETNESNTAANNTQPTEETDINSESQSNPKTSGLSAAKDSDSEQHKKDEMMEESDSDDEMLSTPFGSKSKLDTQNENEDTNKTEENVVKQRTPTNDYNYDNGMSSTLPTSKSNINKSDEHIELDKDSSIKQVITTTESNSDTEKTQESLIKINRDCDNEDNHDTSSSTENLVPKLNSDF